MIGYYTHNHKKLMEKLRVLQIHAALKSGGIEAFLINYYDKMNHDMICFDHIIHTPEKGMVEKRFVQCGSIVYHLPRFNHIFTTFFMTREVIKKGNYKIVHVHHTHKSFLQLFAAWSCGVKVRIAHSHNYYTNESVVKHALNKMFALLTTMAATDYFACSDPAGEYVFGNKVKTNKYKKIRNAIDVEKYCMKENVRQQVRKDWNIEGKFVIAHIGRIIQQKNPEKVVDVFSELVKKKDNAVLLWIGVGEMEHEIKEKVINMGLQEKVIFVGESSCVNELLMGADFFLFPSIFEGLGIVLVEAQVSGLPCLASDVIPKEVKLTDNLVFYSLEKSDEQWANKILDMSCIKRVDKSKEIKKAGYDLETNAKELQQWYIERFSKL